MTKPRHVIPKVIQERNDLLIENDILTKEVERLKLQLSGKTQTWNNDPELVAKVSLCEDEKCPSSVSADIHARINKAVSEAIGNDGPKQHGSWHDLGPKVAKIVAERDTLRTALESLGVDVDSLEATKT